MVVASIDDRDFNRRAGKPVRGLEAAEPGADHHHMMSAHHHIRPKVNSGHRPKTSVQDAVGPGLTREKPRALKRGADRDKKHLPWYGRVGR